jgi:uncharacterized protein YjbJ (UPF0337 family)
LPASVYQEHIMGINRHQVNGCLKIAKGAIKQATGRLIGNKALRARGNIQKKIGKVEAKLGDIRPRV